MQLDAHDNQGRMHLLMAAVALAFLVLVGPFTVPVLLGAVLAAVMVPVQRWMSRSPRISEGAAAALTTLLFAVGLLLPFIVVIAVGVRTLIETVTTFTHSLNGANQSLEQALVRFPWVARGLALAEEYTPLRREDLKSQLTDVGQQVGLKVGGWLGSSLQQLPQGLLFMFIMLLGLYFFMVDGKRLEHWVVRQSPFPPDATVGILEQVKETCARTLLSSVVVSLTQSSILLLGMLITGIPAPMVWFTVAFLMAFIPIVGAVPVSVGVIIYLLGNGTSGYAVVMLVCMLVAGVSDNVVRPLVIGAAGSLHPLILLLSIFGGLSVLGFPGLFIGPVLASLFVAVLDVYTNTLRPRTLPPPSTQPQTPP